MIGKKIGPYEITAKLGEGGMGEVWRATDARLRREVALKVLPEALTEDRERLARFEREAQVLAQLQHPNIASIYGMEESGTTRALVMELVEGPTLAERLAQGSLSLSESLSIARQIAEALEEAHEKGIVHRDLKPQNVKASIEGKVKVLDFGLAKALEPAVASSGAAVTASPTLLNSPTLTAVHGTELGVILGTAAYMAPEQAKGRAVDRRADIWAFGVVLWEMLTGQKLFAGETVAETIGYVMTREPDLGALPPETPAALRDLVARCLVRDPRRRLQAIGDARIVLEEVAAGPEGGPGEATAPAPARSGARLALAVAGGAALAVLALALLGRLGTDGAAGANGDAARAPRRVEALGISINDSSSVAISPDGTVVIGYDMTPSRPALLRRPLDSWEVLRIPGSEGSFNPFFSPDGGSIGFFTGDEVCVMPLTSSSRRCVASARGFASGSWGADGTLVYSNEPGDGEPGLFRVSLDGGEPVRLTTVDRSRGERAHVYPQVLPNARDVVYSVVGSQANRVAAVPLAGGPERTLVDSAVRGRYVRSGHLVYFDEARGRLTAVAFDLDRLAPAGAPGELGFELATTGDGIVSYDVSDNGTLVYALGGFFGEDFTIERVDRSGRMTTLLEERASWAQPRVSPDGRDVLLRRAAQPDCSLWLYDLDRKSLSRLGPEGDHHDPEWLPGGDRFLISRQVRGERREVLVGSLEQGLDPQEYVTTDFGALARSVTPDGRFVALTYDDRRDRNDILLADRETGEVRELLASRYDEDHPAFSPDGKLLAWASDDTGRSEVYVRPFPGPGAKIAVSTHGGTGPVWSRDGRELFYAEGNRMMRVAIERGARVAVSAPELVFESSEFVWERPGNYDVLPDGSGFVMVRRGETTPATSSLRLVFDWFTELERLAPAGTR
ncbi:MAG TPA: protein kinase [Thermoanaerobaculia bacterium]|nr:protein kinase [Thermoanaerobaculia bacterium]